jgi:Ni/Co efflux regulator RcnB
VKALMTVLLAGVLLGSVGVPNGAEAGDRKEWKHRRGDDRRRNDRDRDRDRGDARFGRRDRYFIEREVHVIREYYRPHHRPLPPGIRHRYYRTGYLPRGWAKRMRPVPVHVERNLVVLPHGYHRGIIDGHAVVYNSRGLILDLAVLF